MSAILERLTAALADRYRIERELGQGGMATVYLAHDLKHDRLVAVKVLKPELAAVLGAERFVVEIKTTASMSHPHILPLFDSGTADGFLFYVMPYIEGETLRDQLNRETQLGIDEAVRIAREVLDALQYAHSRGVIHRDIKPENILMQGGRPMIADFGIALAVSAAAGGRMTETGLSLGTPHYMSPEQATAEKEITARADLYSLASVLYEMLTGEPPHTGSSAQQIIMKIITEPAAAVTKYRKSVPANVASAVAKALEKLPADRFQSAKAFGEALGNPTFTVLGVAGIDAPATGARGSRRATLIASGVALVALLAAGAAWMRPAPEAPFRRFDLSMGDVVPRAGDDIAISPDGRVLAMVGTVGSEQAIYLRHLDGEAEFRKLAGTETGRTPAFSPDGQWIVFRTANRALVKMSVNGGGAVTVVAPGKVDPYFPQWGTPDEIVFTTPTSVYRVAASGGEPELVPKVTSGRIAALPDGSGILHSNGDVLLYDLKSDSSVVLVRGGFAPTYVPTGHLVYVANEGGLFAVRFNLAKRAVEGEPARVLERVGASTIARGYAVSASGVLVQRDAGGGIGTAENQLIIVDPGKGADTLRLPAATRRGVHFSPNGRFIAMEVVVPARANETDLYSLDLITGTYTQLSFEGDHDEPVWSPDGTQLLFDVSDSTVARREVLHLKPADNSAPARRLPMGNEGELTAAQWLSDTLIVFDAEMPGRGRDIFTARPDSGSAPVPYLQSPADETQPRVSPDGKFIAFRSDEAGGQQVWLRDFPVPQGKWNVSRGIGQSPRWSPDGRYIYFWRGAQPLDSLFRVRIDRSPTIVVQAPELVLAVDTDNTSSWDLHPDGRRFIISVRVTGAASTGGAPAARYLILQNWFGELKRLTAPRQK